MRTRQLINTLSFVVVLVVMTFMLSSCNPKKSAYRDLVQLRNEIKAEGQYYSPEEWEHVYYRYERIRERLESTSLTREQREEIGRIEGEMAGFFIQFMVEDISTAIQELMDEGKGFSEGVNNALSEKKKQSEDRSYLFDDSRERRENSHQSSEERNTRTERKKRVWRM